MQHLIKRLIGCKAFHIVFPFLTAIFDAVSASRPHVDVAYCVNALARRLAKTRNWAVCLLITLAFWFLPHFYAVEKFKM